MKNKKGFTLAELTITLALVAVIIVAVMSLTATTYQKNYNSRIMYMIQNECQNITNCFVGAKFSLVGNNYISKEFEENIDFLYELESDTSECKSHECLTVGPTFVEYEFYYDEFFHFTDNYDNAVYLIYCKIDYTASSNKLSMECAYVSNYDLIEDFPDIIQKGMGV